jgi:hypothetical protein
MNAESQKKLELAAKAAFIESLRADKALEISHGAAIMPRSIWARAIIAALADCGALQLEKVDLALAILASPIGNSSQIGALLLKDGIMQQQGIGEASESYAEQLAKRLAAR